MENWLLSIFVVNIVMNSFLSFFTFSFLILAILKLSRIKNARLQSICLFVPFLKLIYDLGCYRFSNWALACNINPFECPEGSRFFSVGFMAPPFFQFPLCSIGFHLQDGENFTLADLCCLLLGPFWTHFLALAFIGGTLWAIGKAIWQFICFRKWLKMMQEKATIKKMERVTLYLTDYHHPPCIVGHWRPSLFIPHSFFMTLSQPELEAVIAHEVAHLSHGDLLIHHCLFWICHLFWWIPTRFLKRKLELAQEYACDRACPDPHSLSEVLYKAAHYHYMSQAPSLTKPLTIRNQTVKRLERLLAPPSESMIGFGIKLVILIFFLTAFFLGKFWMF